jgi:lipopolysaccharide/colanic/teichoic acid biosynthesis glycosyltransferase
VISRLVKRALDLAASLVLALLLAPLLFSISAAIALSDGRPIFYRQRRVGRYGKPFDIVKFRTMRSADQTSSANQTSPVTLGENDDRITKIGMKLRRRRLDELPQLLNVIKGEMSLVGPRPEALKIYHETRERYFDDWREVLTIRPGVTGPDALLFKDEGLRLTTAEDPVAYYKEVILPEKLAVQKGYVRGQSLGLDIKTLLRTVRILS